MRVAECAGGRGPTVRVPGVAAAVLAALAAARRSRESGSTGSSSAWQADVTGTPEWEDVVGATGGSERLRGGCRWLGPGQAVTHGHAGAGACPGKACPPPLS